MAGKQGQRSSKATRVPDRYRADYLSGVDRRCRAARYQRDILDALIEEAGGLDGLTFIELEILRRLAHLCRRIGRIEEADVLGERIDQAGLNDSTRSWLGLLRQFQAIKAKRQTGGGDTLDAFFSDEEGES